MCAACASLIARSWVFIVTNGTCALERVGLDLVEVSLICFYFLTSISLTCGFLLSIWWLSGYVNKGRMESVALGRVGLDLVEVCSIYFYFVYS